LEDLFVDPNWMRRGIATTLVARIVDIGNATTEFGTAPRMALVIR
jgi:hypothetical protein